MRTAGAAEPKAAAKAWLRSAAGFAGVGVGVGVGVDALAAGAETDGVGAAFFVSA